MSDATSAPPLTRNGNSTPTQDQQNYAQGRVKQVAMEEAQNAATMVPGTSPVKSIMSQSFFTIMIAELVVTSGLGSSLD
jgi:hypothetical protein